MKELKSDQEHMNRTTICVRTEIQLGISVKILVAKTLPLILILTLVLDTTMIKLNLVNKPSLMSSVARESNQSRSVLVRDIIIMKKLMKQLTPEVLHGI